jgi:pyruvate kinase
VSFPLTAADIEHARSLLQATGCQARIIAKIERAEVVHDEQVLDAMILAVSTASWWRAATSARRWAIEDVAASQKMMIRKARNKRRQAGDHGDADARVDDSESRPDARRGDRRRQRRARRLRRRDALGRDRQRQVPGGDRDRRWPRPASAPRPTPTCAARSTAWSANSRRVDETIAMAAVYAANHLERVAGMVCLTESGTTALRMSRLSSGLPIYALSRHPEIVRRMCLYRGVRPMLFDYTACAAGEVAQEAVNELLRRGLVGSGERLILTRGDLLGVGGSTTTLKIVEL